MTRSWVWRFGGFAVGALFGMVLLTGRFGEAGPGRPSVAEPRSDIPVEMDVLHTGPMLILPGESVDLRFEVVCAISDPEKEACAPAGTLYLAALGDAAYSEQKLTLGDGRVLQASVPDRFMTSGGFTYYATIRDTIGGTSLTVPPGGPAAPFRAWVVDAPVAVDLGKHTFGPARDPDQVVVNATWGSAEGQVGLESGAQVLTVGPMSFDVGSDGSVAILDQLNRRLSIYPAQPGETPESIPINFRGWVGDLVLGPDGTAFIVDGGGPRDPGPVLHIVDRNGNSAGEAVILGYNADTIRMGPGGPIVHVMPSDMWVPVVGPETTPLSPAEQADAAEPGRALPTQEQLVLIATPHEARFALVRGPVVLQAWRMTSSTDLGEVQLAEPFAGGLLVVVRVWTERDAEFVVLHLTSSGLGASFTVETREWAEMSALSRFRMALGGLYQMRSDPGGIEVVRFEIKG